MGMKFRVKLENGRITEGCDVMHAILRHLDHGDFIMDMLDVSTTPTTCDEWRKLYFALRDVLYESVETGYTRSELHQEIKRKVLPLMVQEGINEWFIYGKLEGVSTKCLTQVGWREFVKRFKEFAMETFEIYL